MSTTRRLINIALALVLLLCFTRLMSTNFAKAYSGGWWSYTLVIGDLLVM